MKQTFVHQVSKAVIAAGIFASSLCYAQGIPVIDASNLGNNIITAVESANQTVKQIEQYQTQLRQYENMLLNSAAPYTYVWDKAQTTMNLLRNSIDTLKYFKERSGGIDGYLKKFGDASTYRSSPCYSNQGCSDAQRIAMNREAVSIRTESQKRANDALMLGLDRQQDALEVDARQLQTLQTGAQGVEGQLQAIQFANQFASNQANQLLQIRGLLIAQQNAQAARAQAVADREAQEAVAGERLRQAEFTPSAPRSWGPGLK
jgi:P-type conjugative transfer protein TrbJ